MRTSSVFAILSVVALAGSAYIEGDALAQPPIDVVPFTPSAEFSDDVAMQIRNKMFGRGTDVVNLGDASNLVIVKVTIQPKAVFPWHTHPGPVLISVAKGDFVYVLAEDCLERWYREGQALIDAGFDNVHTDSIRATPKRP
jgi:quercetin dioxygenase-like cupin family protein